MIVLLWPQDVIELNSKPIWKSKPKLSFSHRHKNTTERYSMDYKGNFLGVVVATGFCLGNLAWKKIFNDSSYVSFSSSTYFNIGVSWVFLSSKSSRTVNVKVYSCIPQSNNGTNQPTIREVGFSLLKSNHSSP